MFAKITRINEQGHEKELVLNTEEVAFVTETEPHVDYDKPTKFEEQVNVETGEKEQVPVEWETEPRYLIAFKNGKHPQFLNKENYDKLVSILTK